MDIITAQYSLVVTINSADQVRFKLRCDKCGALFEVQEVFDNYRDYFKCPHCEDLKNEK